MRVNVECVHLTWPKYKVTHAVDIESITFEDDGDVSLIASGVTLNKEFRATGVNLEGALLRLKNYVLNFELEHGKDAAEAYAHKMKKFMRVE